MDNYEDIYNVIGKGLSFPDGRRYLITAGIRIDRDYLLAIPTTEESEITVLIASMNDNGQLLADIYKGKDYDDIYEVLWEKFTGIEDNDHNAELTERGKTDKTPVDLQEHTEAQTIMSVQRTTLVKNDINGNKGIPISGERSQRDKGC